VPKTTELKKRYGSNSSRTNRVSFTPPAAAPQLGQRRYGLGTRRGGALEGRIDLLDTHTMGEHTAEGGG
jgi:hypothetical protein